jgi:hypothetical protein
MKAQIHSYFGKNLKNQFLIDRGVNLGKENKSMLPQIHLHITKNQKGDCAT